MGKKAVLSLAAIPIALLGAGATSAQPGRSPQNYLPQVPFPEGGRLRVEEVDVARLRGAARLIRTPVSRARAHAIAQAAAAGQLPPDYSIGVGIDAAFGPWAPDSAFLRRGNSIPAKLITRFPILYRGIPLAKGSDIVSIVRSDGELLGLRRRGLPVAVDGSAPRVGADAARQAGTADFRNVAGGTSARAGEAELEIWVDAEQRGHLAWHFLVSSAPARPAAIEYYVSALTGAVLSRENGAYSAFNGTVTGDAWLTTPFHPTGVKPLPWMTVYTTGLGTMDTDALGNFSFAGTGSASFTGHLSGPRAVVTNNSSQANSAIIAGTSNASTNLHFSAANDSARAQPSAYHWINEARTFASSILVPNEPRLAGLPVNVNYQSSCNAQWYPDPVHPWTNYFAAGGGCPNTAYSDVVMHEFGHGVDQMNGGMIDGGYSEGFGDALAILNTRQSCTGRDFWGAGTCLRNAATVVAWPRPSGAGVHDIGHVYAGFVWVLVQQLATSMSTNSAYSLARQLIFAAAHQNPSSVPDAVRLSFVADDNDGDPDTCSPHYKALAAAADARGIPHPHCGFKAVYAVGDNGSAAPNGIAGFDFLNTTARALKLDYNGDGRDDLFFYVPGQGAAWLARSNGNGTFTGVHTVGDNGPAPPNGIAGFDFLNSTARALKFDYNGDGKDDLFFYAPGTGAAWVARSNGNGTFTGVHTVGDNGPAPPNGIAGFDFLSPNAQALPFDYDGDGRDDLFFYMPGTGAAWVAGSNGDGTFTGVHMVGDNGPAPPNGIAGFDFLNPTARALAFDYNGDGKDDLFFYAPGTGAAWVARSNGNGTFTGVHMVGDNGPAPPNGLAGFDFLNITARALAFDYDADGRDDLFFDAAGQGAAWVARSNGNGTFTGVYMVGDNGSAPPNGIGGYDLLHPADRVFTFDYNGDSRKDLFLYRPGSGAIFVVRSNGNGSFAAFHAVGDNGPGLPNGIGGYDLLSPADMVLPFDYDGDKKVDLFLYRPGKGAAWVLRSLGD